jgi:GNAT superfamily N-acetyltransferase
LIRALPEELDLEKPYLPEEPMPEETRGEYLLSLDKERLQIDVIEDFLARRSYWGKGRSRADILRTIQNSVCFGIYLRGVQVAFARLVTDHVTFAWLCDVYVDDAQQGKGLGKWLVEAVCSFMDEQGIRHSLLATRDAQGLYQDYGGFVPLESPSKYLNRFHPDPERQPGHRKRD